MKGGRKKFVGDVYHLWPVHQQNRAALVVELPPAADDNILVIRDISAFPMILVAKHKNETCDLRSNGSVDVRNPHLKRVYLIMIHHGTLNRKILMGDRCDVGVVIYVALNVQSSCLFVDSAEITGLFLLGEGAST